MTHSIAIHATAENNAITMHQAGQFVCSPGRLLGDICAHDMDAALLNAYVLNGLSAGLRIAGAVLEDESTRTRKLLKKGAATQNAKSGNVSCDSEAGQ